MEGEFRPTSAPGTPAAVRSHGIKDLNGLTIAVIVLTVVSVLLALFNGLGGYNSGFGDFGGLSPALVAVLQVIGLVTYAQIAVAAVWMHQARSNVRALRGDDGSWGPGWAAGAWFIPLANVVLGFLVVREIWLGSRENDHGPEWYRGPVPAWFWPWWVLWSVTQLAPYVAMYLVAQSTLETIFGGGAFGSTHATLVLVNQTSAICTGLAAGFYIYFMRRVVAMQESQATGGSMPAMPSAMAP